MAGFKLSQRSITNLKGVHPSLLRVVYRALEITDVDFFVNEGVRTPARQKELYAQGRTKPGPKVTWTLTSNHFVNPKTGYGHAVDLYAAPFNPNQSPATSKQIAAAMLRAAHELDIPIRWGADWDRDGVFYEKGEGDSPHFELWGK
jgi:peptidoglycan L-alanyl-D-glutamate endopeptidase CwlK